MNFDNMFRKMAATCLAASGILIALFWILHPDVPTDPAVYQYEHYLGLLGTLLLPVGLVGIYSRLVEAKTGWLAFTGFLLAFFSSLLAIGVSAADTFIWPAIVRVQPALILTEHGHFDQSSEIFTANFVLIMGALPFVIFGYSLLGVVFWRKQMFPRQAIVLFVYAAWATAVAPGFVPHSDLVLNVLIYTPAAIGLTWIGLGLWRGTDTAAATSHPAAA
ncbi:MAG: hypothetical protein KDE48_09390 [Anaerolineales bacterium]|nr:hypothetical protein [Anaerolineales bacterium]